MAPEILRGEEYSLSADVYSFGVILWEIISRKQPFKELNAFAISYQVGTQGKRLQLPPSESGEERQWWRSLLEKCCGEEGERPGFDEIVTELNCAATKARPAVPSAETSEKPHRADGVHSAPAAPTVASPAAAAAPHEPPGSVN